MKFLVFSFILFLSVMPSVHAELSQEKSDIVTEMFKVMGIDRQMKGGFEAMLPGIHNMSKQMQLSPEEQLELENIYRSWFESDLDREMMKNKMVGLYAQAFSVDEIKELIRFYSTPIGKKFLDMSPELMSQGAKIGMEEGQAKQAQLIQRLQPFFEKQKAKRAAQTTPPPAPAQ